MIKLLFLLFTVLKLGKVGLTFGTMLLSFGVYASIWGWRFAAGFLALLFAHEMGHFMAARQRGITVGAPTFIPFVGAWIALKDRLPNVETEAYIAFAGPFIGTLAAFAVYFSARQTDSGLLLAVAYSGFFLNLVNLIPLSPLDGGRITAVLGPRIWLLGIPALIALFLYQPSPLLIVIAILAVPQAIKAWRPGPPDSAAAAYYTLPAQEKLEYGVLYLGLVSVLGLMTYSMHESLSAARSF